MRREKRGFWLQLAVAVLKPPLYAFTRRDWRGREKVPQRGAVIIASNHLSLVDPMVLAHYVYDAGRLPRFLAKDSLFRLPLAGRVLAGSAQIPVYRHSENATAALRDAQKALADGQCVVIYPEGTTTRDPDYWPMRAHTGVARLALDSGAPVVPVGQWGPQQILGQDRRTLRLLPRHTVALQAGDPVDLSRFAGSEPTARTLREATDTIMAAVTDLVAGLRGERPPGTRAADPPPDPALDAGAGS